MLLDVSDLLATHDVIVRGVLHVGAHEAEELAVYGPWAVPVVWVEANPDLVASLTAILASYPHHQLVAPVAVTDRDHAWVSLQVMNAARSSSILELDEHALAYPDIHVARRIQVPTTTIDTLMDTVVSPGCNVLVMDIQGAEGHALRGATRSLARFDAVLCEVNRASLYRGCVQIDELDMLLSEFTRVATVWAEGQDWGDALYVRNRT